MLIYSRIKTVGVQRQGVDKVVISGVLEDELYAMECNIRIATDSHLIESINARMKRFTTVRCPEAAQSFKTIEGKRIDADIQSHIKRNIGQAGCRHMASLILNCLRAYAYAELQRELQEAQATNTGLDEKSFAVDFIKAKPELAPFMENI